MGRVTVLALYLSYSEKVGIQIAITTEEMCHIVVNLALLGVNRFLQVRNERCGPSTSVIPIPSILPAPESELHALPNPFRLVFPSHPFPSFEMLSLHYQLHT